MFDIKYIKENPHDFDDAMEKRNLKPQAQNIIQIEEKWRHAITQLQQAQTKRNTLSKEIGEEKKNNPSFQPEKLLRQVAELKEIIANQTENEKKYKAQLENILAKLPNIPHPDVPQGETEDHNLFSHQFGEKPSFDFQPKQHFELGERLNLMQFEQAAKISGARFVILKGKLARLERALAQYMIDIHVKEHGYTEISPPLLVHDAALFGTGQLPKFADDLFQTTSDHWLIPTAEVPLTNITRDSIVQQKDLPMRFTAHTPCFRSEAGAAGRDTRGMIRQHQFYKVELVSLTDPKNAENELIRMTNAAEKILQNLGLHYRVVILCTGDMGFSAKKTYDIEVWMPGQNTYREISSCSLCGDFQARRMNARYKDKKDGNLKFVHTLNGSGVAVGRALIAVMENGQQKDGTIKIPDVLKPYMGNTEYIS